MKFIKILLLTAVVITALTVKAQTQSLNPMALDEAIEAASANNKKILIDVYAEWCPYCEKMHNEVYTESDVIEAVNEYYYLVKINIESDNMVNYLGREMTEQNFSAMLESSSLPTTYFMNGEGAVLGLQPGLVPSDTFRDLLHFVGSDAYESQSFEEFRQEK